MGHEHHGHDHAGHAHVHGAGASAPRLRVALSLLLALMVVEVAVGVASHSLALLSDAAHMLTDAGALALALWAIKLAARPAAGAFTFGWRRMEIVAAAVNGATLGVLGILIAIEGVRRLVTPPDVSGTPVLVVALVGVAVNLVATIVLSGADRSSLNVEGAFQHVLTDLAAFVATAIAGAVIVLTGWHRADGVAALVVAAIMLRAAIPLLRASGRVFLEAAPAGLDPDAIGRAMAATPDVVEVHDLHVWELGSGFPSLSAHVMVGAGADCHACRRSVEAMLHERFGLDHTTLQVEHAPAAGELLHIAPAGASDEVHAAPHG